MTPLIKLRGTLALVGITLNTLIMAPLLYLFALLRLCLPLHRAQVVLARVLVVIAESWMAVNNAIIGLTSGVRWRVEGMEGLARRDWYLVTSNHQSWADILVLQKVTNRRVPSLKFFLKQQLIWVPLLGLAWWALDFPFMKRYTRAQLEKHPELKGKDMETTRRACEKYAHYPVSVMNFFEGTRFTRAKHDEQGSPYLHLLKPKAGGAAFTLKAMGGQLHTLLDFTIIYPPGTTRSLIGFLGGAMDEVQVIVHRRPIPDWASQGDYENDPEFRARIQGWISELWAEKDALIQSRLSA
ncbi:acyltransferase [Alloalcanivorax profundimaris]|uniref:Acyltransferase n=1 Tax=Alloalcanivorax profundimaris TaxID=2735259 RepID=A0ABS0ASY8_9GAMM|nr:acyltransferase [Alloalcanivorax profundimaris]MAO59967.1 acyltransferase [Alcanivorax sp.]MBM1144738.1 acyltransferase [Alcanivorax sp. ZXX171]UWN47916.1 putative acyltransferase YihG [Alcanivorax sp. ALC70]MAY10378.1 acyltransferase [Alcanivorax sp.]MBF1801353.1 acyltransferase [Alloalcanivorax profundimaris]|tara:strand:- start:26145 stop:27035 length:891 start_codon:yes stop_codon:yes gene_type:complete